MPSVPVERGGEWQRSGRSVETAAVRNGFARRSASQSDLDGGVARLRG